MKLTLQTTCYAVKNDEIIEGKLEDYIDHVKLTQCQVRIIDYNYYVVRNRWEGRCFWGLARQKEDGEPALIIFKTEIEAEAAIEQIYINDILSNDYLNILFNREDAEKALEEQLLKLNDEAIAREYQQRAERQAFWAERAEEDINAARYSSDE